MQNRTKQRNTIKKILIKEETCPTNTLESEIIYILSITNNYIMNQNNLYLFHNYKPTGIFNKE